MRRLAAAVPPWWGVALLGVACSALGGVLIADPFESIPSLAAVVAAAMMLAGVTSAASAKATSRPWLPRTAGGAWFASGLVVAAWPEITIDELATTVGIGVIAGGVMHILAALFDEGDGRFLLGVGGLASAVVGVLAVAWPSLTVLVAAELLGIYALLFGIGQVALAFALRRGLPAAAGGGRGQRRWPARLRLAGAIVALVLALGAMGISVAIHGSQPDEPGPFYTAPSPLPEGPPGTIVRSEVIEGWYDGATTYRVLYLSTGWDGRPAAVSGLIIVPDGEPPAGGREVVAYTHGTVGVAPRCAPSIVKASSHPLFLEGGQLLLAAGYVIAAPDYQGLGSPAPHPYLVGASEGMNTLDAVRAARNLEAAQASARFAVWGHSQGGHASLFTGQLAAGYAPDLELAGC